MLDRHHPSARSAGVAALVLATVLVLVTAACGSSDGSSDGDAATTTGSTDTAPGSAPGSAADDDDGGEALGELRLERLDVDLDQPIAAVAAPAGDALLVAQRGGEVVEVAIDGAGRAGEVTSVVDLRDRVGSTDGERGLLGIAVDPGRAELYVSYTRGRDGASQLESYRILDGDGPTRVDEATRRTLVDVAQPFANHNGGHVVVGPDGMVYLGLGDGGGSGDPEGHSQDRSSLLGKLLRLDPAQADGVARDNPFVDDPDARAEIWLTGVRNPWRFGFDRATGDLWIADVGQNELEEVTVLRAADGTGRGANLGWDLFEGDREFADADPAPGEASSGPFVDPQFTYSHDEGCSITGGVVYRGELIPGLVGRYLFTDFCTPGLRSLSGDGDELREESLGVDLPSVVGFAEDSAGEVYVLSLTDGMHRLTGR
ncbi:MAG: PQQ-dependent sugar dehydrogenase [Microthrixaceae bacterium]